LDVVDASEDGDAHEEEGEQATHDDERDTGVPCDGLAERLHPIGYRLDPGEGGTAV
jgi:hypothetical protein